ncbi:SDR family oxidoreductase [Synechococcus sp. J7-Johnson]|uniref:SDR family NAD(P)-dependent oxidoreductase n=1 Tax=Synechococcus sp. J7-Johnson TaxID=2823737 RepID=UPI0020CD0647|nr:SDR family NAD(P)-dependent oxidoreductase [Synechococcus sp. J7-Johnson]MCP9839520.1 SDR family oxidoreductase [Synechococcus sp. J7-Johnson]
MPAQGAGASEGAQGLFHWRGDALVVGGGGIGQALLQALAQRAPALRLWATSRRPWPAGRVVPPERVLGLDLTDDSSLEACARRLQEEDVQLRLVINTAGLLHDGDLQPEKRLQQLQRSSLERLFSVNAYGPALLARSLEPLLPRQEPVHFASLSARVGSIGDNQLGGWYGYRAAKAAQNQLLRCLALEWERRLPLACVSLLHPGTTATALSEPFRRSVPAEQLFKPERAANQLLDVIAAQGPAHSGRFLAWDGTTIPW